MWSGSAVKATSQTVPRATTPRRRPAQVKQEVVRRKGYTDIRLVGEEVAEFFYQPGPCARHYLVVVLRKHLVMEKNGKQVGEETRDFFYVTNEWDGERAEVALRRFAAGGASLEPT